MHDDVVAGFVSLFQGGKIARSTTEGWFGPWEKPDGSHYEASGAAFYRAVEAHLTEDGEGIGVYPLIAVEGLSGAPEAFVAWWGCVAKSRFSQVNSLLFKLISLKKTKSFFEEKT